MKKPLLAPHTEVIKLVCIKEKETDLNGSLQLRKMMMTTLTRIHNDMYVTIQVVGKINYLTAASLLHFLGHCTIHPHKLTHQCNTFFPSHYAYLHTTLLQNIHCMSKSSFHNPVNRNQRMNFASLRHTKLIYVAVKN